VGRRRGNKLPFFVWINQRKGEDQLDNVDISVLQAMKRKRSEKEERSDLEGENTTNEKGDRKRWLNH